MLKSLTLKNVGPAPEMHLDFGSRLNILTGDNGLGKSFLLDIIWWSLTRTWPAQINASLTAGKMARPHSGQAGLIQASFSTKTKKDTTIKSEFTPEFQTWPISQGRPGNPGLVLYAMSDGSFAVWDPARNYWRKKTEFDVPDRPSAYVFNPSEVWYGQKNEENKWLCNGLIRDWATWQENKNPHSFEQLKNLLAALSASKNETLVPGDLVAIDIDDDQLMPTIRMPYGQDIPVIFASAGIRRMIALAYFISWSLKAHRQASEIRETAYSNQVIFLIDETEAHLHPKWQRVIVPALLNTVQALNESDAQIQLITATHSPLIMSSIEPEFDSQKDAWFDIDLQKNQVILQKRAFEKLGGANDWLCSEAFNLTSTRASQYEQLLERASCLLKQENPEKQEIFKMNDELLKALNPKDPYLIRWQYLCEMEGWFE